MTFSKVEGQTPMLKCKFNKVANEIKLQHGCSMIHVRNSNAELKHRAYLKSFFIDEATALMKLLDCNVRT